jgi:hypothetical protein
MIIYEYTVKKRDTLTLQPLTGLAFKLVEVVQAYIVDGIPQRYTQVYKRVVLSYHHSLDASLIR